LQLGTSVSEAIESIRAAVDRAAEDRRRGEEHMRRRLIELQTIAERCGQACAEFQRLRDQPVTLAESPRTSEA
jgi:hypothetical protein